MLQPPRRTGRSPLTDAELYLFDALFDKEDRVGSLRREQFGAFHNLPYTHDLDAAALSAAVARLEQAGLVRFRPTSRRPDLGPWVRLTPAGGRLWELERNPDWSRFCVDSSAPEGADGRWVLRIRSCEVTTAEAFLDTAVACRLYGARTDRTTRRRVRLRLVPWQVPRELVELQVPLDPDPTPRMCDWPAYEARRTWWRTIGELSDSAGRARP